MRRALLLAVPLLAVLVFVACDDDDDDAGGVGVNLDAGTSFVTPDSSVVGVADAAVVDATPEIVVEAGPDADLDAGQPMPPLTNLEVWLRADKGVTADGGKLEAWADQSGKGHDFTQPNTDLQPTVVDSDAGTAKTVLFTGLEHLVADTTQLFPTNTSPLTVAISFTSTEVAGQKILFNYGQSNDDGTNANLELGYSTGDQTTGDFGLHRGSSIGTTTAGGVIVENTVYHAVLSLSATGADPTDLSIHINGVDQPVASATAGGFFSSGAYNTASAPMEVGGRVDGNHTLDTYAAHLASIGDSHHIGTISEVLVYKGGLEAGDLPLLEAYLSRR